MDNKAFREESKPLIDKLIKVMDKHKVVEKYQMLKDKREFSLRLT